MIKNRIQTLEWVTASELEPHRLNWRSHPPHQKKALKAALEGLGFADAAIARRREDGTLQLLDGHLRQEVVAADYKIPVLITDLTEEEGNALIATLDPLAGMAETDQAVLDELLQHTGDARSIVDAVFNSSQLADEIATEIDDMPVFDPTLPSPSPVSVAPGQLPVDDDDDFAPGTPAELPGALQLVEMPKQYPSDNPYGIPTLLPEGLLSTLPQPIDTWAHEATPDDGRTTWLWNYSLGTNNLPWDRTILSFFTDDSVFENWWWNTAHYVGKMINLGIRMAVEPDFSAWNNDPPVMWMYNTYRSRFLARYMQDVGIKVIPRIPHPTPNKHEWVMHGFPKSAPILAISLQTPGSGAKDEIAKWKHDHIWGLNWMFNDAGYECETLIAYGGNPAKDLMAGANLPCKVKFLDNYLAKRRQAGLPYRAH